MAGELVRAGVGAQPDPEANLHKCLRQPPPPTGQCYGRGLAIRRQPWLRLGGDRHGRLGDGVRWQAPADKIWDLIADVRNTGKFTPEVMEAEWLGGATGPALGNRFRGHVKRNEIGPTYWTTCKVTACEPGRELGFAVLMGDKALNNWHYKLEPTSDGDRRDRVVSHRRLAFAMKLFGLLGGQLRHAPQHP